MSNDPYAQFKAAQREGWALFVPLEAVTKDNADRSVVTAIDAAGHTSVKPVKLGLSNNKSVEVIKGIQAGQRLVLTPNQGGN